MNNLLPLVVIVGPTAVGKTELGVKVAKKIQGEIISGDSMQVYKYMDIGTAKPSKEEMGGIPHYMLDIIEPDQDFSVAIFQREVERLIRYIYQRKKIPVLVGGTGLYVRSVIDHYDFTPPGSNKEIRTRLSVLAGEFGNEYLVEILNKVDPKSAARIHPNDTKRLVRALEVYYITGRPISEFQYNSEQLPSKYNLAYFGLNMARDKLYEKIELRVDTMIRRGLVDEVRKLLNMGYGLHNTSMQAIGYKEIINYINGHYDLDTAIEIIKRETRRFAKRQLTWFRRDTRIQWFNVEKCNSLEEIADEISLIVEGQFGNM